MAPSSLGDASSAILNSATVPSPSRKCKKMKQPTCTSKCLKNAAPVPTPPSESCRVGPSALNMSTSEQSNTVAGSPTSPVSSSMAANPDLEPMGLSSRPALHHASSATDVWYFLHALDTDEVPSVWPNPDTEPRLTDKPKSKFVGCKLCMELWKTWHHCGNRSMTSCYHTHLQNNHCTIWELTVQKLGLKGSKDQDQQQTTTTCINGVFNMETFYHLLMCWIIIDDQSLNVVKCQEFHELILYLTGDELTDEEFIHHKKLCTEILLEQKRAFDKLKIDLHKAEGCISFTTDLWSDPLLQSFMAITAHFLLKNEEGHLGYHGALIAFK
ncbi:hypothetical protein BDQ17DRAFT_1425750 [Cyathus striatus]|nr:hypothetical protein BDQ17DRAFT_1425750 [Cyathus striatus]